MCCLQNYRKMMFYNDFPATANIGRYIVPLSGMHKVTHSKEFRSLWERFRLYFLEITLEREK